MNCARWFSRLRRSGHLLLIAMFLTVSAFHPVGAQTLTTGDLAFVSFNADEDGWSIVTFVDIAPDTIIYFSDNEASSTTTFVDSLESSFQWDTGASTIPAGAVVRFSAIDVPTRTVSIGTFTAVNETNPGLSTSNETLYAYLGTSDTQPTTFLTAVSSEGSTFLTPAGLTDGINAVVLTASTDYGEYNGPRSGQASFADYKALVNNSVNWTIDTTNDHSADVPNTTNFTTGAATPAVNLSVSSNTGSEEEQTVITVTVTASSAVTDDQTIDVAVTGANITASDYSLSNSIITIPSGSTTGSVALTVVDDALVEGTETATLTISNPSAGITLGSTTSQDITIIDNDGAPTFDFSAATYSVIEGNTSGFTTSATITIVRTGSTVVTDTVTVQLSDGTATGGATPEASGVDYNNSPIAVTFDPGETSKDVSVFVVGDTTVEADETVNLSLTNPSAGSTVGTTHPTAVLTIQNDDVNPAPDIDVQGKGVRIANGDTTPDSADDTNFGSVTVGSTVTHTFTISNGGTADLTGVAVTVSGSSAFAVTTAPATTTVGAGTTTSFNLRFAPTVPGTVMATVSIASNDPDENPYTFVVAGTAAGQPINPAPDIDVQGKGVRIANGDTTPDSADDTNFGSVTVGSTVTHTFTISNGGTADLTGVAVTVSGSSAFAVTTAPATTTVGAGTTTSFNLRFAPTVPGTVTATVSIASNDPDENPYTFVVAGTAAGQPNVRLFLPLVARGQDDSFIAVEISR